MFDDISACAWMTLFRYYQDQQMSDQAKAVKQVSFDTIDRGITPSPEVGPEKRNGVHSSKKPGPGSSELQHVQDNGQ